MRFSLALPLAIGSAAVCPALLDDLGDAAGADGAAAFADGEAEAFVHGDGVDQAPRASACCPPGMHISVPSGATLPVMSVVRKKNWGR